MRVEIELTDKLKEYVDDYIDIGGGDNVFCYPDNIIKAIREGIERKPITWITTDKQLPEVGQRVLVSYSIDTEKKVAITIYDKVGFAIGFVDAWMPLPEPYKITE